MTPEAQQRTQEALRRAWTAWKMPIKSVDTRGPVIFSSYLHPSGVTTTLTLDEPALTVVFELIEPGKPPLELWRESYPTFEVIEKTWLLCSKHEIEAAHRDDYDLFFGDIADF